MLYIPRNAVFRRTVLVSISAKCAEFEILFTYLTIFYLVI